MLRHAAFVTALLALAGSAWAQPPGKTPPAKAAAPTTARQRAQELAAKAAEIGLPINLDLLNGRTLTRPARDPAEGLKLFGEAIAADPICFEAYMGRAALRGQLKDQVGNREDLEKAASIDPNSLDLQSRLVSLGYDFEDAEAVKKHSAAWLKAAIAEREKAGKADERSEEVVRFALRAEAWNDAIALCDRFIASAKSQQEQIPFPYLRSLAYLALARESLTPADLSTRQDRMTNERIDQASKNPQASADSLLAMARAHTYSGRLPMDPWPLAARLEIYDRAIQKTPGVGAAYFERANLKWAEHKSLAERTVNLGMTSGRTALEYKLANIYSKAKVLEDCDAAAKAGLDSKELTDLKAAVAAYEAPKPKPPAAAEVKSNPGALPSAEEARMQWIETVLNEANRELGKLRGAYTGERDVPQEIYQFGAERVRILAEELLRLDPARPDGWKLRGAYRIGFANDLAGSKEDLLKAAQLGPARMDVQLELSRRALRLSEAAESRKIAAEAYRKRVADLAKGTPPVDGDLLAAELAFYADQWNDVLAQTPKPAEKFVASFLPRRLRILSLAALGNSQQVEQEQNLLSRSNQGVVTEYHILFYYAKNPKADVGQLEFLIDKFRKNLGQPSDIVTMYDRLIETDPKLGGAYLERAVARWTARKAAVIAQAKATVPNPVRDYELKQVFTAERIAADLDAAEKLGVNDPRLATTRDELKSEQLLAALERDPTKVQGDPKQLLAFARLQSKTTRPFDEKLKLYDAAIKAGSQGPEAYFERADLAFKAALDVTARYREAASFAQRSRGKIGDKMSAEFKGLDPKPILADIEMAASLGLTGEALDKLEADVRRQFDLGAVAGWKDRLDALRRDSPARLKEKGIDEAIKPWDALVARYSTVWEIYAERLKFLATDSSAPAAQQFVAALQETFKKFPGAEKEQNDNYLALIAVLNGQGARERAGMITELLGRSLPASGESREKLAWTFFDSGSYAQARKELMAVLAGLESAAKSAETPSNAPAAANATQAAPSPAAINRLRRQVELLGLLEGEPAGAVALAKRANLWSVLGENDKAIADYTRVIELEPKSVLARCWRAGRHIAKGNYSAAQADIDAALALDPKSAEAYACQGALQQSQLDLDGALTTFDKALELSPRQIEAYQHKAQIFYTRGDLEKTFEELAAAALVPAPEFSLLLPQILPNLPASAVASTSSPVSAAKPLPPLPAGISTSAMAALRRGSAEEARSALSKLSASERKAAAVPAAIVWLTSDADQNLYRIRGNSDSGATPEDLAAVPERSPFHDIFDGAAWRPVDSPFRHEPALFERRPSDQTVARQYRKAWRAARARAARAETLEDVYARALTVGDAEALELLRRAEKAPARYAEPLLGPKASETVRQNALALLTTKTDADKARQSAPAWQAALARTREQSEKLLSAKKPDEAAGQWLGLATRYGPEKAIREAGRAEYAKFTETGGSNAELLASLAFALGDYPAARRHLLSALDQRDPLLAGDLRRQMEVVFRLLDATRDAVSYIKRANALAVAGSNEESLGFYNAVVEAVPKSVLARSWRAGRLIAKGDYAGAQADIDEALKLHPESAQAWLCRGALHQARMELDPALTDFARAIELSPRRSEAYVRRAMIYYFRGDLDKAYGELRQSLYMEPADEPTLLPMRLVRREPVAGDPQPAIAVLPDGPAAAPVVAALVDLVRGDVYTAGERLDELGPSSEDWVWFARGMAKLARDEDQEVFTRRPASESAASSRPVSAILAARADFANADLDAPGEKFLALYPPDVAPQVPVPAAPAEPPPPPQLPATRGPRGGRPAPPAPARGPAAPTQPAPAPATRPAGPPPAEFVDATSSFAHNPARYYRAARFWTASRDERQNDPAVRRAADLTLLEDIVQVLWRFPTRRTETDDERLALLRKAQTAPTHLYDDPLLIPELTKRTRMTALMKLLDTLVAQWRSAKDPAPRAQLEKEVLALDDQVDKLQTELAGVFAQFQERDHDIYNAAADIQREARPEARLNASEAVIKKDPQIAIGYLLRAAAKMRLGKWPEARTDIDLILKARMMFAEGYVMSGAWHQAHYHFDEALQDYAKAISLNPRGREPYLRRALIHYFHGRLGSAFDDGVQAMTIADERIQQPLSIATDLAPAVAPPQDLHPAASLLADVPPMQRAAVEAAMLKLVAGDLEGARKALRDISTGLGEPSRLMGLINDIEYFRDPINAEFTRQRDWAQVFGTGKEYAWEARRDRAYGPIAREGIRRGRELGERPWKYATGRIIFFATRAADLVGSDRLDLAAAKLKVVTPLAEELRKPAPRTVPWSSDNTDALRAFDRSNVELALKTGDLPGALRSSDRVFERNAQRAGREDIMRWSLERADLVWEMGDPLSAIDDYTRLIYRYGTRSQPETAVLVKQRNASYDANFLAARGALWLAAGKTEEAWLDYALASLEVDDVRPLIEVAQKKYPSPLKGDPVKVRVSRLVTAAKNEVEDQLPDLGVPDLEQALKLRPDDQEVKKFLVQQLGKRAEQRGYVESKVELAIDDAKAALALAPDDPAAKQKFEDMLTNAEVEYAYNRWKENETPFDRQARLRKAITFRPTWPDQRFDLVLAYVDSKSYPAALAESDRAAERFEANLKDEAERKDWDRLKNRYVDLLRYRALNLFAQVQGVDRLGATIDLKRALEIKPDDAVTWSDYGKLVFIIGDTEKAQPLFDKAMALDPKLAPMIEKFKVDAQGSFVRNAKEIHDRRFILTARDRFYAREYEAALADLAQAAESFPDDPEMLTYRGGALLRLGKREEGMVDLRKAAEKKPIAATWNLLGEELLARGQFAEAEEALTKAMNSGGGGYEPLGLRAVARGKQSKFDAALNDMFTAHQSSTLLPEAKDWLARRWNEVREFKLAEVDAGRQKPDILFDSSAKSLGDALRDLAKWSETPAQREAFLKRAIDEKHGPTAFEFGKTALGSPGSRDLKAAARWFAMAASFGEKQAEPYVEWLKAYVRLAPGVGEIAAQLGVEAPPAAQPQPAPQPPPAQPTAPARPAPANVQPPARKP